LAEGTAGIKALGDEAERLGFVLDDEALAGAEAFQDAVTDLTVIVTGLKRAIGIGAAPAVKQLLDRIKEWLVLNRELIRQRVEAVIEALSDAVIRFLDNAERWIDTFEQVVELGAQIFEVISRLADAVGGLTNLIKLAAVAWGTYQAAQALALGPIGVAITALGLLAVAFADVETAADRAAKAENRFGKATAISKPLTPAEKSKLTKQLRGELEGPARLVSTSLVRTLAKASQSDLSAIEKGASRGGFFEFDVAKGVRRSAKSLRFGDQIKRERARLAAAKAEEKAAEASKRSAEAEGRKRKLDEQFRRLRRIGAPAQKAKPEERPVSDEELLQLIDKAASTGQSLTGLIGDRRIEGTTPPVIAVRITRNEITQNIDAQTTVNGASSEIVEELAERVAERQDERFQDQMLEALQNIQPTEAR
jgi:hypothetical protein